LDRAPAESAGNNSQTQDRPSRSSSSPAHFSPSCMERFRMNICCAEF
jgi:hypothetical protein